jgi:hypothetical protein
LVLVSQGTHPPWIHRLRAPRAAPGKVPRRNPDRKSVTQLEYEEAGRNPSKPRLVFTVGPDHRPCRHVVARETLGNAVHPGTHSGQTSEMNIFVGIKAEISQLFLISA